jgi:glycosyltransferase involved in cell wall biosynthesis
MPKISIIVPIYNEGKTVGEVLKRLLAIPFVGWDTEIIAVNDASTDTTEAVLEKFFSRVIVINLPKNKGKGGAVNEGLQKATGDFAIIQDADLECLPEEIPLLLKALGDISLKKKIAVMGSREINTENKKRTTLTGVGARFITSFINFLWGTSLTDALMCYKLFPRETFGYFSAGRFESEILFVARLLQNGYHIIEVPVSYFPRSADEGKKIRYRDGLRMITRIAWFRVTGK